MTTIKVRAKKGGEFGANGEWYKGGQFINTVAENPKNYQITQKFTKSNKHQVAPFCYKVLREGYHSIYEEIHLYFKISESEFKKGDWKVDFSTLNFKALVYYKKDLQVVNKLARRFNMGYRQYKINDNQEISVRA